MTLKTFFLSCLCTFLGLSACTDPSEMLEEEVPLGVTGFRSFPERPVKLDTSFMVHALFQTANGCGRFSRVDTATVGKVFTLKYYAQYPVDLSQVVCTDVSKPLVFSKRFSPQEPGTYTFRFWESGNTYVEKTIIVVE